MSPESGKRRGAGRRLVFSDAEDRGGESWRGRMHEVIFEADTRLGKAFDVALLVSILLSVAAVILESVEAIASHYGGLLRGLEWAFTILFTIEYLLRLVSVRRPWRYARSFFGLVDLLAILPTYIGLFFTGAHSLIVIRALRLLRVFRVFKLVQFVGEERMLGLALKASFRKIVIFVGAVMAVVVIAGTVMYLIEGGDNGFSSIPVSIYWAIVTMTTVGYGDIAPQTVLGKAVASALMIAGYGIIAVPTGIVTVELTQAQRVSTGTRACPDCSAEGHAWDARHCKFCGALL